MNLRYLDDHDWCDLVFFQWRPSLDDFVNMFAEEEMGGTSRVTDVEGWVLLERNSVQKFFFQKILYEWSLWSNVLLLCFRTVFFFFLRHIPNKMKVSILVHFILRGFADVCAASKARRTIVSDTFPQLCNGHVFLQFPWTYHPSEKLTSPFPPGCAQNGKAPHA